MLLACATAQSAAFVTLLPAAEANAAGGGQGQAIIKRHVDISRGAAAREPLSEDQQKVIDGWPLYRTERGQAAFNQTMATLKASEGRAPMAASFAGCNPMTCRLTLPMLSKSGWIPAGRLWLSSNEYMLIVHSPRRSKYDPGRRRGRSSMRYFVFHEFQNSNGNTDIYDTISAHRRSVFVPFYLSKPHEDAMGRRYVVMVQVAPHDIVSIHASNYGSAGPGIEVAKNTGEKLHPLQAMAGVMVATIVKAEARRLRVIHHRNVEGLPMLKAYNRRMETIAKSNRSIKLPFVPVTEAQVASATGSLGQLIVHAGLPKSELRRQRIARRQQELRPSFATASVAPRLVALPKLIHYARSPLVTVDRYVRRVFTAPPVAPRPQLACRRQPDYRC